MIIHRNYRSLHHHGPTRKWNMGYLFALFFNFYICIIGKYLPWSIAFHAASIAANTTLELSVFAVFLCIILSQLIFLFNKITKTWLDRKATNYCFLNQRIEYICVSTMYFCHAMTVNWKEFLKQYQKQSYKFELFRVKVRNNLPKQCNFLLFNLFFYTPTRVNFHAHSKPYYCEKETELLL